MIRKYRKRVIIIGAGEAGRMVAAEINDHSELNVSIAGFLDDNERLQGKNVSGLPVLGITAELEEVAKREGVDEVIIAVPTATGEFVRNMIKRCRRVGVPFKIVPGVMEIIKGTVHIEQIRDVEVEDLLGRETVDLDTEETGSFLAGKRILVTGAGGSIGSEISRQLARVDPQMLILLGRGENRIFDIEDELRSTFPRCRIETVIGDLRNAPQVDRIIEKYKPHIIYHTAAHKHVHYMEREPEEAVMNNIEASINLIDVAERSGVERFVFISTDKAANPIGVMGATKRIMELYLRSRSDGSRCRLITVRFGNVIGSKGSVVPLFLKQINRGGPVTVSDPEATRYFMTVKEASLLVIRASIIGKGGETFILDMGEPLSILEIAKDLIILSGYEPEKDIPILITGLREGEKLHEELVSADEELVPIDGEKIYLARSGKELPRRLDETIERMISAAHDGDRELVLSLIGEIIPSFKAREH
ncbi:MAG: hypothetical protein B6D63_04895 [Candidatus Latescibacteria bacterium 4484_7]|nr:MAG: hypothetical protein B6D63_04895 [Candidatus Latescibacteria bacterium 4484_7]